MNTNIYTFMIFCFFNQFKSSVEADWLEVMNEARTTFQGLYYSIKELNLMYQNDLINFKSKNDNPFCDKKVSSSYDELKIPDSSDELTIFSKYSLKMQRFKAKYNLNDNHHS